MFVTKLAAIVTVLATHSPAPATAAKHVSTEIAGAGQAAISRVAHEIPVEPGLINCEFLTADGTTLKTVRTQVDPSAPSSRVTMGEPLPAWQTAAIKTCATKGTLGTQSRPVMATSIVPAGNEVHYTPQPVSNEPYSEALFVGNDGNSTRLTTATIYNDRPGSVYVQEVPSGSGTTQYYHSDSIHNPNYETLAGLPPSPGQTQIGQVIAIRMTNGDTVLRYVKADTNPNVSLHGFSDNTMRGIRQLTCNKVTADGRIVDWREAGRAVNAVLRDDMPEGQSGLPRGVVCGTGSYEKSATHNQKGIGKHGRSPSGPAGNPRNPFAPGPQNRRQTRHS